MKTIMMDGEVYTKKSAFVDAFGEKMEAGKKASDVKGDIRRFLNVGNHRGKTFTLTITESATPSKNKDFDGLAKLARKLGATERQIKKFIKKKPKAHSVGFLRNT